MDIEKKPMDPEVFARLSTDHAKQPVKKLDIHEMTSLRLVNIEKIGQKQRLFVQVPSPFSGVSAQLGEIVIR